MLNRKRLRAYATIIGVTMWTIWIVDMSGAGRIDRLGKVKGTDFLHFYVMGSIARDGRWDTLFDLQEHQLRAQRVVPGSNDTVYIPVESPQLALLLAPFASLGYIVALTAWLALVFGLYVCACALIWRDCPALHGDRSVVIAACAAFPGLYSEVLHGQTAALSLALIAIAFFALRRGWRFASGVALGSLVFKPHWAIAAGAVFFFAQEWRVVGGIIVAALAQTALTGLIVGAAVMRAYWEALRAIPRISRLLEPQPGDSLKGFFDALVPYEPVALILYAAAALTALVVAARVWRGSAPIDLRLSAVSLTMLLICPHVNVYDLILLAPVVFMLADWLVRSPEYRRENVVPALLFAIVASPLMSGLPALVRLQFSVTAMAALLFCLWRAAAQPRTSVLAAQS